MYNIGTPTRLDHYLVFSSRTCMPCMSTMHIKEKSVIIKNDMKGVSGRYLTCNLCSTIYWSTRSKAAIPNLQSLCFYLLILSRRGLPSIRVTLGVSFCPSFLRVFFSLFQGKSNQEWNGNRASLWNNRASRDRESRRQNISISYDRCDDLPLHHVNRLQWRRNVTECEMWVPIEWWGWCKCVMSEASMCVLLI